MLDVRNVTRKYGDNTAVNDVSFSIARGEIVGLLGHNGAGKTTLMKIISGHLEPHAGEVSLDDLDLIDAPTKLQQQIGYLPEHLPAYGDMKVLDYLEYAAHMKGITGQAAVEDIQRVLAATELEDKQLTRISTLSRGYKQRVGVAQAIMGKPSLLILDEPTNGLDPSQTEQMRALLRTIAQDATVILSTHIMQEVEALCSRVLIIDKGLLSVDRPMQALTNTHKIKLRCSATVGSLQSLTKDLSNLLDIAAFENAVGNGLTFIIDINPDANLDEEISQLVSRLCSSDIQVYQVDAHLQSLEHLFTSSEQEAAHV